MPDSVAPASSHAVKGLAYLDLPRAPEQWVVENLIPVGGLFNIFGQSKGGKSFIALQLAADVASGSSDWMGFPIHTPGPVLYVQLDTPRSLWAARVESMAHQSGLDFDNVWSGDTELAPYPFNILGDGQKWLAQECDLIKPTLVIIDTIRELHSGDENDSAQMKNVFSALVAACRPAAICILSHSRKDNLSIPAEDREDLMNDNRGSSYIPGRMDGIMRVTSTPKTSRLTYQSRTTERHTLKCRRLPGGLWAPDAVDADAALACVMADASLSTISAKASQLASLTGKTLEACRSLVRRRASEGDKEAG